MNNETLLAELTRLYNPTFDEASSYDYLQNLVIHLSAKKVIEERQANFYNHGISKETISAYFKSLDFEPVMNNYLNAASKFMPAFYMQFDLHVVYDRIMALIRDTNGVEKCNAFLKLNRYNPKRQQIVSFAADSAMYYAYDKDSHEVEKKIDTKCLISLFKEDSFFELELYIEASNVLRSFSGLLYQPDVESLSYKFFKNESVVVCLKKDTLFPDQIIEVTIENINPKWIIQLQNNEKEFPF